MDSIQEAATECNGFKKVIPKNKDDENRIEAIEGELIKLGSETNMDIVQYSLVNWEQVEGESPKSIQEQPNKGTHVMFVLKNKNCLKDLHQK